MEQKNGDHRQQLSPIGYNSIHLIHHTKAPISLGVMDAVYHSPILEAIPSVYAKSKQRS